jgi:O-antigen/teichoic acid export membrane protein
MRSRHSPIVSNSLGLLGVKGAVTMMRLLLLLLVAYWLPPHEFGLLAYAIAVAEIGRTFADFGLDTLAIRRIAQVGDAPEAARVAGGLLSLKAVLSAVVFVAVFLYYLLTQTVDQQLVGMICALLIFSGSAMNAVVDYFQAKLQTSRIVSRVLVAAVLGTAAAFAVIRVMPTPVVAAVMLVLVEIVMTGILLIHLNLAAGVRPLPMWPNADLLTGMLRGALPIAASGILIMIYTRLDVLFLSAYSGKAGVAEYSVAYRLTEPFQFVAVAFAASVFSHLSQHLSGDSRVFVSTARKYIAGIIIYGIASAAAIGLLAPAAITYFLPAYVNSIPVLWFLAGALLFRPLNSVLTSIVQAHGKFAWITANTVWTVLFISALLIMLVAQIGAPGAALALLIGEVVNTLVQSVLVVTLMRARRRRAGALAG